MRNTNENIVDIRAGRRVGNTTRQADKAIQWLFEGEAVEIEDHCNRDRFFKDQLPDMNRRLADIIVYRLAREHNIKFHHISLYAHPKLTLKLKSNEKDSISIFGNK